jgi:hypothetical protein
MARVCRSIAAVSTGRCSSRWGLKVARSSSLSPQPTPRRHPGPGRVGGEDGAEVAGRAAEQHRPRPVQRLQRRRRGGGQVGVDGGAVGQQAGPAGEEPGRAGDHHQARRDGHPGAVGVRRQAAVAEPGRARMLSGRAQVGDGGDAVRAGVRVREHGHHRDRGRPQPGGVVDAVEHRQPVDRDPTRQSLQGAGLAQVADLVPARSPGQTARRHALRRQRRRPVRGPGGARGAAWGGGCRHDGPRSARAGTDAHHETGRSYVASSDRLSTRGVVVGLSGAHTLVLRSRQKTAITRWSPNVEPASK